MDTGYGNNGLSLEAMAKRIREAARAMHDRAARYEKIADGIGNMAPEAAAEIFKQLKDQ